MRTRLICLFASLSLSSCGGRSAIPEGDAGAPLVPCKLDADCIDGNLCATRACEQGYCKTVQTVACDDGNVCTLDSCAPSTGQCVFASRVTDNDGDGVSGPLPGMAAGSADSCGSDCNDTNPAVYPGATEICDGLDNNCNGAVDEGIDSYDPLTSPVRIADSSFSTSAAQSIAYDGSRFGIAWTGEQDSRVQSYVSGLDVFGFSPMPTNNVSQTSVDASAGPLIWTGSNYATAWEVRGEKGYDIYFNELDIEGTKFGPDIRITNNRGFSVYPALLWNGVDYSITWSDDVTGSFQVYGQKINKDGQLGSVNALTAAIYDAHVSALVRSPTTTLLVFLAGSSQRLIGQLLNDDLTLNGSIFYISETGANDFSIDWVNDRFVVAWNIRGAQAGDVIWGATIDPNGQMITAPRPITSGANFAVSPNVLSLGDRFALAWADDRVTYNHFGIRLRTFDNELNPLVAVTTLAETNFDSLSPILAAGGPGMALVYRSRTNGKPGDAYFVPLACSGAVVP